ncbi:ABC-three component system middle component 6 [Bacillus altitudinis]|uniref:ABC-three component system middle component 6 n=1 Tax=Bacillus altitudinis TaxID=293387 RepID=UPI002F948904
MLLLNDMKPEMSIYYCASLLIKEIGIQEGQDIVTLYKTVKEKYQMSLKIFAYCLDWLYLVEAAKVDNGGGVFLCT